MLNEENQTAEQEPTRKSPDKSSVPLGRRVWLELKDMLAGVAFPLIISVVLSSTVILGADYTDDIAVSIIALIGGEIMLIAALIMFGRANGTAAYDKTLSNAQKRGLGATDERVVCGTGEYAIWKSLTIALIMSAPFIIFQIIELCYHTDFTTFCLKYVFGWAYYPFSYLGEGYQSLNFLMLIIPFGAHTLGYYLGKQRRIKIQEYREKEAGGKRRKK